MSDIEFDKLFPTNEEAFINSAYLSELWAVHDLLRLKKEFPQDWGPGREAQLEDEVNHSRMLLDALKNTGTRVVVDLKYSMQEKLYRKYMNMSQSTCPAEISIIHQMTENRAVWIYKTFIRLNSQSKYNPVLQKILKDEESHLKIPLNKEVSGSFIKESIQGVDRLLFREYLPEKYGPRIFLNKDFWKWYYKGAY